MMGFGEEGTNEVESSKGPNSMEEDMGAKLELIRMKIHAIEDPEDERLPELIKERRLLEKTMFKNKRMKQIKEDLERLVNDEFDDMSFMPIGY
jgi:hypothetical protein